MGDRWVNTVLIPGIYEGFYEAMKVVVDILGKLWNGFMTGISRIVVPFYGKLDTSGAMVDTTASALHYAERLNWVDATRRKNVAIFNKAEQDNLNRINETQDKARANRLGLALKSGMVEMNGKPRGAGSFFGGVKQSGLGREGSSHGMDEYLEMKYLCVGDILK